ncbi:hypothetical protein K2173_009803 [Erythroxylum novogranatense]|uniref:Uncharacterized protein n=1 Tax=Erythroxylum novogranatense TaxID=1862640 RepID=A0AAV8SYZ4_9ROSI|nr:hypothetical protein K2173_009803 [Erythroxylum novogranatense]
MALIYRLRVADANLLSNYFCHQSPIFVVTSEILSSYELDLDHQWIGPKIYAEFLPDGRTLLNTVAIEAVSDYAKILLYW